MKHSLSLTRSRRLLLQPTEFPWRSPSSKPSAIIRSVPCPRTFILECQYSVRHYRGAVICKGDSTNQLPQVGKRENTKVIKRNPFPLPLLARLGHLKRLGHLACVTPPLCLRFCLAHLGLLLQHGILFPAAPPPVAPDACVCYPE